MTTYDYDILIAGGGLVGASIACALAQGDPAGHIRIGVIEAGDHIADYQGSEFDPRVVALTHASQQYLATFGAWELVEAQRLCPYTDMSVWDAEGTGTIEFDSARVQQEALGHIVENSVILKAIAQRRNTYPSIDWISPVKLIDLQHEGERVSVSLEETGSSTPVSRQLSTRLLIGADGANSRVRQLAEFKTREWDYGHKAIITTVKTEKCHQFTARQRFLQSGPLAFLPLLTDDGDTHYCSIVWSVTHEKADELMQLDDDDFLQQLSAAFEYRLGHVVHTAKRFCIPLRQRHATRYVQPGIALVGDAAHTIHPLAGQGVNLGFLDAKAIVEELLYAHGRRVPLQDHSILRRYQRTRMGENLAVMSVMEAFKRLFEVDHIAVRWARNAGMRQLNHISVLKNKLIRQAMGLG